MQRLKNIKAVLFDMDGLLVDTEHLWLNISGQVVKEMGINLTYQDLYQSVGRRDDETIDAFTQKLGSRELVDEFYSNYANALAKYIDENGLPPKKGAIELLDYLKNNGYKLALASSSNSFKVETRLKKSGIGVNYFDSIIAGDMVKEPKPHPYIYLKSCEVLGVEPNECIVLEDSAMGIEAGFRAGCKVIAIPDVIPLNEKTSKMIYAECKSLDEVIDLF